MAEFKMKLKNLFCQTYTGSYGVRRKAQVIKVLDSSFSGTFSLSRVKPVVRFCVVIFVDILIGLLLTNLLEEDLFLSDKLAANALYFADLVVYWLQRLIVWLMGAPAGLKLNSVLSQSLGRFFLYHIHLWVSFLHVATPHLLNIICKAMHLLVYTGFSFQVSVFQDSLNIITFHIHCFYAYARRLFLSQSHGLLSLWRLFRGKKYNPLRDRVDSSSSNVDQLFVGTVAFTVLLFLFPTSLVYYCVFKTLDLVLNRLHSTLSWLVIFTIDLAGEAPEEPFEN